METEMFMQHEAIRSEIYKLLAECYYPPDGALSVKIVNLDEKLEYVCPRARQDFKSDRIKILRVKKNSELKVDYTRLFVGPYTLLAPPYGSVYLEPECRMMGNSTMDVVKRYHQSGLAVAEGFKDAPDHIAAELEYMHFLIFKAMEAANKDDIECVILCLLNQQSFLADHLGAWIHEFAVNVTENAKTSFYQNLARATKTFVKDDFHILSTIVTSLLSNPEQSPKIESSSG